MSENIELPPPPPENLPLLRGAAVVMLDGQRASAYAAVWAIKSLKGAPVVACFTVHGQRDPWRGYEESRMICEALKLPFVCAHLAPFEIDEDGAMVGRNEGFVVGMKGAGANAVVLGLRRAWWSALENTAWWAGAVSHRLNIPVYVPGAILPDLLRAFKVRDALGAYLASRLLPD